MPPPEPPKIDELLKKYKQRIGKELDLTPEAAVAKPTFSREYKQFKKEYLPKRLSFYEKACNISGRILKLTPDKKKAALMQEDLNTCHLNITPTGVLSFAVLAPLLIILLGSLISFAIFEALFFVVFFLIVGLVIISPLMNMPRYLANNWRMKASNQMVLCIFYMVTYMRHTSNLEHAINFAAEHLSPPLSLDLKKILWDVETEKYESVKESLDEYLETWRKYNKEFIEAFHLIESSLYEPSESRRLSLLDKSLDVILTETYEKMLHYAHNLKSPITMLHMLGIILPILGLVILPLIVNFLGEVKWYHIATLYNIVLPIGVHFLGKSILSKRPTGYGDTDISEENPELKKYRNVLIKIGGFELAINPLVISIVIGVIFFLIGMSPLLMHSLDIPDIGFFGVDGSTPCGYKYCLLEYRQSSSELTPDKIVGPYGIGSAILSVFAVLGISLSFGIYYKLKSKNVIKIRNKAKKLEDEFASALFQLGNRLGDGLPAEIAFGRVAEVMKDSVSGSFFEVVSSNIRRMGMSVEQAIFNPKTGAIVYFPSKMIDSSMKVLIQSIKKGPKVAAQSLTNIARYIKEIHKVNERLRDLMADIISSMKAQISFLTPAIAGIVVGITSMVTTILGKLGGQLGKLAETGEASASQLNLVSMFGDGIPTYYFQLIVGLYVVQIAYILTIISNGIENGSDKLAERYALGNNLTRSIALYAIITLSVMLLFNIIAGQIMQVTFV
ncbi:hypothetical protein GOV06_05140 [Candidatus Woesearchaeota archaeon]|nr:hypothetical protein [Candidatus Woesearchaeota archaeon]